MKYSPLFAATMLVCAVGSVAAAEYKAGSIEIDHAWSRATPKGASTGAGYLAIRNTGTQPDRLIGGSIDVGCDSEPRAHVSRTSECEARATIRDPGVSS